VIQARGQAGLRLSIKACTPSGALASIILQAQGVSGTVAGGLHAHFQLPVKQLLAQRQGFWSTCDP